MYTQIHLLNQSPFSLSSLSYSFSLYSLENQCLSSTGWENNMKVKVRDLWLKIDLPDIVISQALTVNNIPAEVYIYIYIYIIYIYNIMH